VPICTIEPEVAVRVTFAIVGAVATAEWPEHPEKGIKAKHAKDNSPNRRRRAEQRLRASARPSNPAPSAAKEMPLAERLRRPACAVSVKVTVELAGALPGVTVAGLKVQVTFAGSPAQEKVTTEAKPLTAPTVRVVVAGVANVTVPLDAPLVKEKSIAGVVTVTTTAGETDAANAELAP